MRLIKWLAAVSVLLASWMSFAQVSKLRTGISQTEVRSAVGKPDYLYVAATQQRYPYSQASSVWQVWGGNSRIGEVYYWRSKLSEYEVMLFYKVDDSKSRLHPTLRVEQISFRPDKKLSAGQLVSDIPQVREICGSSCSLNWDAYGDFTQVCPSERIESLKVNYGGLPAVTMWMDGGKALTVSRRSDIVEHLDISASVEEDACRGKKIGEWLTGN